MINKKHTSTILFTAASVCLFMTQSNAQSTSSASVANPSSSLAAAAPNTSTATADANAANANAASSPLSIQYLGIFNGPEADFAAPKLPGLKNDMFVSHRPAISYKVSDHVIAGVQTRFRTTFMPTKVDVGNENFRLFGVFTHIAETDLGSLTVLPRVMLPTSNNAHNEDMLPSPELILNYGIAPKGSRFNFAVGNSFAKKLYKSDINEKAQTLYSVANFESTYQFASSAQITFGYYPEFEVTRQRALYNTSHEMDLGVSVDVAKGWSVNPYISAEMNGMQSGTLGKQTAFNLILNGTFL
jgi:hypothetical protein